MQYRKFCLSVKLNLEKCALIYQSFCLTWVFMVTIYSRALFKNKKDLLYKKVFSKYYVVKFYLHLRFNLKRWKNITM